MVVNAPATEAGAACDLAAQACIVSGMSGPHLDMAGALATAAAYGVEQDVAATLIAACGKGMRAGIAESREDEPDQSQED